MRCLALTVGLPALLASAFVYAQAVMPSAKAVQLIHALEQAPLAEDASKVRSDLVDWAAGTQDVTITLCDVLGPIPDSTLPYGPELLLQAMLGNGAFQLEHPEHRGDAVKTQVAGIKSMLLSYEKILVADPEARIPQYDEWLLDLKAGLLEARVGPDVERKCSGQ